MWLFGSVHELPAELQPGAGIVRTRAISARLRTLIPLMPWYRGKLQWAFRRAQSVVLETTEVLTPAQLEALTSGHEGDGRCIPLTNYLDGPASERLQALIQAHGNSRLPRSASSALFTLSTLNAGNASAQSGPSVDGWLGRQAHRAGKTIVALESARERLAAMQRAFRAESCERRAALIELFVDQLAGRLAEDPGSATAPNDSIELWRYGKIDVLARQLAALKAKNPALHDAFLGQRNRAWLPRLVEQLESSNTTFVVVGIAHLAGPGNLVAMLEARGLRVRRVQ